MFFLQVMMKILKMNLDLYVNNPLMTKYCKFRNFRESFTFTTLCIYEVSHKKVSK